MEINSFLFLSRVLSKMADAGDIVKQKSNVNNSRPMRIKVTLSDTCF